ncbi:MAG: betaine/proline/choline family ABC transporter ATP-binding protein, partial [Prochlorococcus sp.]|nr:betaine/proline/choline family ABC transporter ATP-binding protein [Prochlorococcus sp.]
ALHAETGIKAAVSDVSLSIEAGEIFVVMGLSGSGKSTLLRMINGLISPSAGEVVIEGKPLTGMSLAEIQRLRRSKMAMVFQSFALFPQRTALENAAFGLEVAGVPQRQRLDKARQALERVGLGLELHNYPHQLSGGMQQRVGLARALALDPPILLMDEAFSALDPLIRREMQEQLLELQAESSRTIVFISHDLDEAVRLGDRIALMKSGKVLQCDSPSELLSKPANEQVRHFFRDVDAASVLTVKTIAETPDCVLRNSDGRQSLESAAAGKEAFVVDDQNLFIGVLRPNGEMITAQQGPVLTPETTIREAINSVVSAPYPVPIVGADQRLIGVISPRRLLGSMLLE